MDNNCGKKCGRIGVCCGECVNRHYCYDACEKCVPQKEENSEKDKKK